MHAHPRSERFGGGQPADLWSIGFAGIVLTEPIAGTKPATAPATKARLRRIHDVGREVAVKAGISVGRGSEDVAVRIQAEAPRVVVVLVQEFQRGTIGL